MSSCKIFVCAVTCISVFHYSCISNCSCRWLDYICITEFVNITNPRDLQTRIFSSITLQQNPEISFCLNVNVIEVLGCINKSHVQKARENCAVFVDSPFFNYLGNTVQVNYVELCFPLSLSLILIGNFGLVFGHVFNSHLWLSVISSLGNCCWLVYDYLLCHLDSHCRCCKNI